jgi:acyl carrier protein
MNPISVTSTMPIAEPIPGPQSELVPTITESRIKTRLRAFVQENFLYAMPNFELRDDDLLMERGVVDSMGVAEMIAFVESEFGVFLSDDEITEANFGSLSAIVRFVSSRQPSAVD